MKFISLYFIIVNLDYIAGRSHSHSHSYPHANYHSNNNYDDYYNNNNYDDYNVINNNNSLLFNNTLTNDNYSKLAFNLSNISFILFIVIILYFICKTSKCSSQVIML